MTTDTPTGTALATVPTDAPRATDLAIRPDQSSFDEKQIAALRALGVEDAPKGDIDLLFHQSVRLGLDPFARQIYLIGRASREKRGTQWVDGPKKWSLQTGIDGFRVVRDRKGTYDGQEVAWCGPDGVWKDVWTDSKPPFAARVLVYVKGRARPETGIAYYSEYAQTDREGNPQAMWKKMPAGQLLKCAEALALRKAFPQDLSGVYVDEEMDQAGGGTTLVTSTPAPQPETFEPAPWEDRLAYAGTSNELHKLWLDAGRAGVLDEALSDGQPFRDAILGKKARLDRDMDTAPDPAPKQDPAGYDYPPTDDQELPF